MLLFVLLKNPVQHWVVDCFSYSRPWLAADTVWKRLCFNHHLSAHKPHPLFAGFASSTTRHQEEAEASSSPPQSCPSSTSSVCMSNLMDDWYTNASGSSLKATESGRDIVECQFHEIVTSPGSPSLAGSATVSMCSPTVASSVAALGLHESFGSPNSTREEAKGDDNSSPSPSGDRPSGSQVEEALTSLLGRITKAELPEMEEEYGQMKEAQVIYPYVPQEEDELLLNAGERVYLLGLSQPEWYVAVRASVSAPDIGLVPQNYVKLL
jgi:hypothetical protein